MLRQRERALSGRRGCAIRTAAAPVLEGLERRTLLAYGAAVIGSTIAFMGDNASDVLALDISGGLLRHNRFSAGDGGFVSELDFDCVQAGEQTVASNAGYAIVVNAGPGDDVLRLADGMGLGGGTFEGGAGIDTLDYAQMTARVIVFLGIPNGMGFDLDSDVELDGNEVRGTVLDDVENVTGGSNSDLIYRSSAVGGSFVGGPGNDTLQGGDGNDTLDGGDGNDILFGWPGDDVILGGEGDDSINGHAGNDSLSGGGGNDTITGELGNDSIAGNAGADLITGDGGDDLMVWNEGDGLDVIDCGGGMDTARIGGTSSADVYVINPGALGRILLQRTAPSAVTLDLGVENLEIAGGEGDDSVTVNPTIISVSFDGGAGNDSLTINGTANDDAYTVVGAAASSVRGTIAQTAVERWTFNALGGNDSIDAAAATAALVLNGGDGNDTLVGGAGADSISGGNGHDSLAGGDGNDTLAGGAGQDTLAGGAGNDIVGGDVDNDQITWTVGSGSDALAGGDGVDTLLVVGTENGDTLSVGDAAIVAGAETVTVSGVETVSISALGGNDSIDASASTVARTINGGDGDDSIRGGSGADSIDGGAGQDALLGGAADDTLLGGGGNDTLDGNAGNDQLTGAEGDDLLIWNSQEGADTLTGGDGADSLRCLLSDGDDTLAVGPTQIQAEFAITSSGFERLDLDGLGGNDSLALYGTDGADTFVLGDGVISGGGWVVGLSRFEAVTIQAAAGDDRFEVQTTTTATTLLGGDGNDAFVVSSTGSGTLRLNGQLGSDSYAINLGALTSSVRAEDSGEVSAARRLKRATAAAKALLAIPDINSFQVSGTAGNDDIEVTSTQVLLGEQVVDLGSGVDALLIRGLAGDDTVRVNSTSITLAVQGNEGYDTFVVAAGLAATVQVNGGEGKGRLVVNGTAQRDMMRVTDQRIINANGSAIRYQLADTVTLNGLAGNDTFTLLNVSTPTYINGGDGGDLLITDAVSRAMYDGGAGADRMKIQGTEGADNIRISADAVNRGPTYAHIEAIDVLALGGDDRVDATGASVPVAINGGAGDDTLTGSAHADWIDGAFGNDSILGNGGSDRLYGQQGADILIGGAGGDVLSGGRGYDQIFCDKKDAIDLGGAARSRDGGEVFNQ